MDLSHGGHLTHGMKLNVSGKVYHSEFYQVDPETQMINYETGAPHTAHTTNPVPFILANFDEDVELREGGDLADIVPTLIDVMGMEQPKEMTGKSLLIRK